MVTADSYVEKDIVKTMLKIMRGSRVRDLVFGELEDKGIELNVNFPIGRKHIDQVNSLLDQIANALSEAVTVHEATDKNYTEEMKESVREAHITVDNMGPNKIIKISDDHRGYTEIYAVSYPVQFFFDGEEFDGIEIGPFSANDVDQEKHMSLALEINTKIDLASRNR